MTKIKICGITSVAARHAAIESGADFLGFVFYPPSPRDISDHPHLREVTATPEYILNVGLFVNPAPEDIARGLEKASLDMIQLHGNETVETIEQIKGLCNLPVMKAIRIATEEDFANLPDYEAVCDWLLFDVKSSTGQGGTGERFDWELLKDVKIRLPWMLAGGLTPGNVKEAINLLHPPALDVSSGVESAPGQKDPARIQEFIAAVRQIG